MSHKVIEDTVNFSSGGESRTAGVRNKRPAVSAVKYSSVAPLICIPTSSPHAAANAVKVFPTTQVPSSQRAGSTRVTSVGNSSTPPVLQPSGNRSLLSNSPNPVLPGKSNQTIVVADSSSIIRSVPAPVVMGGGTHKKQIFTLTNSLDNVGNQASLLNSKDHKYFNPVFKNKKCIETSTERNRREPQNLLLVSGPNSVAVNQTLTYILPKTQKAMSQKLVYAQVSGSRTKRPVLLMAEGALQTKPNISLVQSNNFPTPAMSSKQESVSKPQAPVTSTNVSMTSNQSVDTCKQQKDPPDAHSIIDRLRSQEHIIQKLKPGTYIIPKSNDIFKRPQNQILVRNKKVEKNFSGIQATTLGQIVSGNPAGSVTNFHIANGQIVAEKVTRPHMLSLLCDNYKFEVVKHNVGEKSESKTGINKKSEEEARKAEDVKPNTAKSQEVEDKLAEDKSSKSEIVAVKHNRRKQELAIKQDAILVSKDSAENVSEEKKQDEKKIDTLESGSKSITTQDSVLDCRADEIKKEAKEEIKENEGENNEVFNENSDPEKENKSVRDLNEPEKFDPIKYLEWSDNIGSLPLSDLKFRLNEFGLIEVVEEDEDEGKISSKSSVVSDAEKTDGKNRISKKQSRSPEEILRCHACGTYGMGCEFVSSRFCSSACSKTHEEEKAESAKKLWLKEEKKMKLRQQKSSLLQQRAKLQELGLHEAKLAIDEKITMLKMERELMKTSAGESDAENCSGVFSNADRVRSSRGAKAFSWTKYLTVLKAKSAPYSLFKDPFPTAKNNFKVGMKLEGIDPVHPSLFCVLTVVAVRGYRIKLHFDGYPDCHDFWVNANSSDIFHPGWCERTNHKLTPPKGYEKNFNWGNYLRTTRTVAAPKSCFVNNQERPVVPSGFRRGMKLEAVDKKNSSLVCVATIADVLDNRILVHFDGWDDIYDYWVDCTSPYIHPAGWCRENGHQLTPPNDYKEPSSFSWNVYLRETKSLPAPARAFKPRTTTDFHRGMKLECVDKRNPILIRVATVVDIVVQQIKIKFDGWPDQYAYWLDDDSPDLHPAGWCQKTGHPLEPPPSEEDIKNTALCPTPGCRGIGHVKGKHAVHHMVPSCPYSSMNYLRDDHIPDRFSSKREYYEVKETSASKGTKPRPGVPRKKKNAPAFPVSKPENRGRKRKMEAPPPPKKKSRKATVREENSGNNPRNKRRFWSKGLWDISETVASIGANPLCWTPSQVAVFVENINNSAEKGKLFAEQQIDGEALLMLSQNDLIQILGFKLGPAIKLYKSIGLLREKALEIKNGISI